MFIANEIHSLGLSWAIGVPGLEGSQDYWLIMIMVLVHCIFSRILNASMYPLSH
jgi:hypothetical protein